MINIRTKSTRKIWIVLALVLIFINQPASALAHPGEEPVFPSLNLGRITSTLEILHIPNVSYTWQTVSLENTYTNPIPICSYVLPTSASNPAIIRIQNLAPSSFEIKIQGPVDNAAITTSDVFCIIAEEGLHTLSDGRTFEAHSVTSDAVNGNSGIGWSGGEDVSGDILGTYTNPVVLGQVISYNNASFSAFWSYDCDSAGNIPFQSGMADGICVGRHIGQTSAGATSLTRATENISYIVVEGDPTTSGSADPVGNLPGGSYYEVALGADTVDGVDNGGTSYNLNNSGYTIGLVTEAAIDGNNGGWAVLYGASPLAGSQIDIAIDEDTLGDTERSHTTENVSYWVFDTDPGLAFMESFVIPSVGSAWQTVNLNNNYTSMVPVCSYHLPTSSDNEVAIRIQNINNSGTPDSFQIRIQQPRNGSAVTASDVHCIVVEEGTHTIPDANPLKAREVEAYIVASNEFNENNDWNTARMENVGYTNSYNRPVVFGQVISYNDSDFSLFWSNNGNNLNPPDAANLYVGKHVGEDPGTSSINDEELGYLLIEAGSGFSDGFFYEAALGTDTVEGVGNSPPYTYTYSSSNPYTFGVVSQEAMDGSDGSWAVLYGANPLAGAGIDVAADEEIAAGDTSRTHTTEQIAYWVFDPVIGGTVWNDIDIDGNLEALEPLISNHEVWLCPDTFSGIPSWPGCLDTLTDGIGDYYFRNISPGDYYIAVPDPTINQSSTWGGDHDPFSTDQVDDGVPAGNGFAVSQIFTYTSSTGSTYFDFGFVDTVEIGGAVWSDMDVDGIRDVGEIIIAAVPVWLCPSTHSMPPASPPCMSTSSDSVGDFYFSNITSGDYYFAADDLQPSYQSSPGGNHDPSINDEIDDGEPTSGGGYVQTQVFTYVSTIPSTSFDFGFVRTSSIGGGVWDDSNGDGVMNDGGTGIAGVNIELFDSASISQGTTTTAANGSYIFSNVYPGDYYLNFTLPAGLQFSPQDVGGDDTIDSDPDRSTGNTAVFSITADVSDMSRSAGMYPQGAHIFDPPSGWKTVDHSGWPTLVWRQVWINDSNVSAVRVRIEDPIPADTAYITGSLVCTPTGTGGTSTTTCNFDGTNIIWEGTIAADPGATDESSADNELVITFETTVTGSVTQVENQSRAYWDENGDDAFTTADNNIDLDTPELSDDPGTAAADDPTLAVIPASLLPDTGFEPGFSTDIIRKLSDNDYTHSSLKLVIPQLGMQIPIAGIPYLDGSWDTSWLGNMAGYLEGSAYPTHTGNSILTAHVWDALNRPGPFSHLNSLSYGDDIIIINGNSSYYYKVISSRSINPDQVELAFEHKSLDWLSLLTCEGWDPAHQAYSGRRLIQAIFVRME